MNTIDDDGDSDGDDYNDNDGIETKLRVIERKYMNYR